MFYSYILNLIFSIYEHTHGNVIKYIFLVVFLNLVVGMVLFRFLRLRSRKKLSVWSQGKNTLKRYFSVTVKTIFHVTFLLVMWIVKDGVVQRVNIRTKMEEEEKEKLQKLQQE